MTRRGHEALAEKKKLLGYTESKGLLGVNGSVKKVGVILCKGFLGASQSPQRFTFATFVLPRMNESQQA
jgi:hypothetical protein